MKSPYRRIAVLVPLLFAASLACGQPAKQVMWKIVDKNGKVTYVDQEPPKDFDGQVTRIEVDLAGNRAAAPKGSPPPGSAGELKPSATESKRAAANAELAKAQSRLETARKALADGREPTEAETQWIGKKGGGARPVPTEAHEVRVRKLEDEVKAAEAEVERAQKAARQAGID